METTVLQGLAHASVSSSAVSTVFSWRHFCMCELMGAKEGKKKEREKSLTVRPSVPLIKMSNDGSRLSFFLFFFPKRKKKKQEKGRPSKPAAVLVGEVKVFLSLSPSLARLTSVDRPWITLKKSLTKILRFLILICYFVLNLDLIRQFKSILFDAFFLFNLIMSSPAFSLFSTFSSLLWSDR